MIQDYEVYAAMTEDEVEDEYRRAGKLDKYDPETELLKRYARIAKKHPPPDGFDSRLEDYFKLIEDEDKVNQIGRKLRSESPSILMRSVFCGDPAYIILILMWESCM